MLLNAIDDCVLDAFVSSDCEAVGSIYDNNLTK